MKIAIIIILIILASMYICTFLNALLLMLLSHISEMTKVLNMDYKHALKYYLTCGFCDKIDFDSTYTIIFSPFITIYYIITLLWLLIILPFKNL